MVGPVGYGLRMWTLWKDTKWSPRLAALSALSVFTWSKFTSPRMDRSGRKKLQGMRLLDCVVRLEHDQDRSSLLHLPVLWWPLPQNALLLIEHARCKTVRLVEQSLYILVSHSRWLGPITVMFSTLLPSP